MLKNSSTKLFGNERYEGFGIDVIHELSVLLGFKYEFKLHPDTIVGEYDNDTKSWTGIIGELRSEVRVGPIICCRQMITDCWTEATLSVLSFL